MKNDKIEFTNAKELYNRVIPALECKINELNKVGINYVTKKDLWMYFVDNMWRGNKKIELHNIVNDILHADNHEIDEYISKKIIERSSDI